MTELRRDEEFYALQVFEAIKTNLNTRIAAINAEKNDGITLRSLDSNAYYYEDFGQDQPVYDPVVIFAVNPEEAETLAGESHEELSVSIQMVISSQAVASSETLFKTIARYRRAIKESLKAWRQKLPNYRLVGLPQMAFTAKTGTMHHVLGVGVRFKFVN